MDQLLPGTVVWVALAPTKGREQSGHRPVVVISSLDHLRLVTDLAIVLPCTTVNRHWPNHVELTGDVGLDDVRTFAMTEQPRTVSRTRITRVSGTVDKTCLAALTMWLRDWTIGG